MSDGSDTWATKAKAIADVRNAAEWWHLTRDQAERYEGELRVAVRAARKSGIPDTGIAEVAEISPAQLRERFGARGIVGRRVTCEGPGGSRS